MKKKKKLTLLQKRSLMGYLFVLPWVVGFWFFTCEALS